MQQSHSIASIAEHMVNLNLASILVNSVVIFIPTAASITLQPQGVSLSISPKLGIAANLSDKFNDEQVIATIPLDDIDIPGVLQVGPGIKVYAGYQIGPVVGNATLSSGISISISDSVPLTLDLMTPGISGSKSWETSVNTSPLTLSALLNAAIQVWVGAGIELGGSVLGENLGLTSLVTLNSNAP